MTNEWLLKRNCSMSPAQVGGAYGLLSVFVLAVGAGFALQGIWFVLIFSLIEMAAVAVALLIYARHATDREHIALAENGLWIERTSGSTVQRVRLDPCWTRVTLPAGRRTLIQLEARGVCVEVGAFVGEEARQKVAAELRAELKRTSFLPQPA